MCMNDNETVNLEIDSQCATTAQESEAKTEAQKVCDKVTALAARMMDGHIDRKNHEVFTFGYGLDMDEVVLTDEGVKATRLLAAGMFLEGGAILRKAMYKDCLENACAALGVVDADTLQKIKGE